MKLDDILDKLADFREFSDVYRVNGNPWPLGNHQLVPVYDMVENGLRRVLLAFATGAGKTVVPLEVAKHIPGNVLVVAPKQSMQENWDEKTLRNHGLDRSLHQVELVSDAGHNIEGSFKRWWEAHTDVRAHGYVDDPDATQLKIDELEHKSRYRLTVLD